MKYRVHVYAVVRFPVEVEADNSVLAAQIADEQLATQLSEVKFPLGGENGEETVSFVVDPLLPSGEVDYENVTDLVAEAVFSQAAQVSKINTSNLCPACGGRGVDKWLDTCPKCLGKKTVGPAPSVCECGGSGIRQQANPSCELRVPDGWQIVERCDACRKYENDLEAALALTTEAKWIKCTSGGDHAIAKLPSSADSISKENSCADQPEHHSQQ